MNNNMSLILLITAPSIFAMQPEDKNFSFGRFAGQMQAQEQRIVTEYEFDAPGLHPSAQEFFKDRFAEQQAEIAHLKKIQIEQEEALERWKAAYDEKNKILNEQKLMKFEDQAAQRQRYEDLHKIYQQCQEETQQALNTFQESKDDRLLQLRKELGKPVFESKFVAIKFEIAHENAMQNPGTNDIEYLKKRLETPALKETLDLIAKSGNPELLRTAIAHCVYASWQSIHFPLGERKLQLEKELTLAKADLNTAQTDLNTTKAELESIKDGLKGLNEYLRYVTNRSTYFFWGIRY